MSFSYRARESIGASSQSNLANLTREANLEVRVGYLTVCVREPRAAWKCTLPGRPYPSRVSPEQDPLNLVEAGKIFMANVGLWELM
jgi:hypothetical protein